MNRHAATEVVGWYGFAAILFAYAASNLGWLLFGGPAYQILNLTGALALLIDALSDRNWQVIVLNGIWAIVASISLLR